MKAVLVLEPNNRTVRAQLDATSKLIRRLEFEKAIKVEEGRKAWMAAVEHLENGTGGTSVRADYTGPRLPDGEGAEAHLGSINQEFIDGMIEHYKSGGHLPLKYAWQIILGAHRAFMNEPSLVDFEVQKEQTVDVVGDTHGQVSRALPFHLRCIG